MRTASLFKNGNNQTVRLPKKIEFEGAEVKIKKEGESIILTSKQKSWTSFTNIEKADGNFLLERPDVVEDGQVKF